MRWVAAAAAPIRVLQTRGRPACRVTGSLCTGQALNPAPAGSRSTMKYTVVILYTVHHHVTGALQSETITKKDRIGYHHHQRDCSLNLASCYLRRVEQAYAFNLLRLN